MYQEFNRFFNSHNMYSRKTIVALVKSFEYLFSTNELNIKFWNLYLDFCYLTTTTTTYYFPLTTKDHTCNFHRCLKFKRADRKLAEKVMDSLRSVDLIVYFTMYI